MTDSSNNADNAAAQSVRQRTRKLRLRSQANSQIMKFALLAVVMLGAIPVVALARPIIFDRIVPSILGPADRVVPLPPTVDESFVPIAPSSGNDSAVSEPYPAPSADTGVDAIAPLESIVPLEAYPAPEGVAVDPDPAVEAVEPAGEPDPLPPEDDIAVERIYTVQAGDNLSEISTRFGVSIEAILLANGLTNPDAIVIGDVLTIPAPP